jgi:hypothetical protein
MVGDIVGFEDGRKMSLSEFQTEQLALAAAGWKLKSSEIGHSTPCACGSIHVVYMTYERDEDMKDFNLCLECGSVFEQVPVFERDEQYSPETEAWLRAPVDEYPAWLRSSAQAAPVVAPVVAPVAASPVVAPVAASPVEVLERRYFDKMDYTEMEWYVRHVESEIKHLEELLESFGIDPNKSYSVSDVMAIKAALVGKV